MIREERFWAKVDKTDSCWLWTAAVSGGYGRFWDGERLVQAHCWAYEHAGGIIPEGWQVDHLCKVELCVRPLHLEAVTPQINTLRSTAPSAIQAAQTHCIHGHPFDEANTYHWRGHRTCRTCGRGRLREYRLRAKVVA